MSAFIICWLPFFVLALVRPFLSDPNAIPAFITSLFLWLGYCNSLLNPIIYATLNRDFRKPFREILYFRCGTLNHMMREEFYQSQYGDPVNNYEIKAGESAESADRLDDRHEGIVESMDVAGAGAGTCETGTPNESFLWSEKRRSSKTIVEDRRGNIRRKPPSSCCIEQLHVAPNEILLWFFGEFPMTRFSVSISLIDEDCRDERIVVPTEQPGGRKSFISRNVSPVNSSSTVAILISQWQTIQEALRSRPTPHKMSHSKVLFRIHEISSRILLCNNLEAGEYFSSRY